MSDEAKPWWQPGPHDAAAITVEPHGPGEAIYVGRDEHHHGLNVALVTETDPARWPAVRERLCAMRLDGSEWDSLYDALELVGDDRTPKGAALGVAVLTRRADFTVTLPPRSRREHGWTAALGCVGAIIAMAMGLFMPEMACFGAFFGMTFGYHFAWYYLHHARDRGVARDRVDEEDSP